MMKKVKENISYDDDADDEKQNKFEFACTHHIQNILNRRLSISSMQRDVIDAGHRINVCVSLRIIARRKSK